MTSLPLQTLSFSLTLPLATIVMFLGYLSKNVLCNYKQKCTFYNRSTQHTVICTLLTSLWVIVQ